MPLNFSNTDYIASLALADFTGKLVYTKFTLTAASMGQAITDAQTIANRVKAMSAHQVVNVRVTARCTSVDSDSPTESVENTAYFAGETTTGRWAVLQIPGYNGPFIYQNNIELANTLVNDLLILFTDGGVAYVYDNQAMAEFCRGWALERNKQLL